VEGVFRGAQAWWREEWRFERDEKNGDNHAPRLMGKPMIIKSKYLVFGELFMWWLRL
jgi:hypothetical protein